MTPIETVRAFLAALEAMDFERVLELSDPEIVYENVGLAPARGLAAFTRQMRGFEKHLSYFEVRMKAIAADGNVVLTERVDVIEAYGVRIEPWVCGSFEVRGGRVILWRDYFDWSQLALGVLAGLPRGLGRALRGR